MLRRLGRDIPELSQSLCHIIASGMFNGIFEIVVHDMPREQALREQTGLDPEIEWSDTGRIQLNEEVTVTLTHEIDLGLFAGFGSFPITLRADATGKSEVYWK